MDRRHFLGLSVGVAIAAALGAAGVRHEDPSLWYRAEEHLGLGGDGPDLHLPSSHARLTQGSFESRYMKGPVPFAYSVPAHGRPTAVVVALYGKGGDQLSAFGALQLPDAAAYSGASLAIASAYGGSDSYWHKRADGTDAHAMVVREFVPLVRQRLGQDLPFALYGYSMGGYGALLAAEKARGAGGDNQFRAVAASSPALWQTYAQTRPGAFDSARDFAVNDVFADVGALRSLAVRLDCGDFDPFYTAVSHLSSIMRWPHIAVFTPGAGHDVRFWRSVAPAQMSFLSKACAAAY